MNKQEAINLAQQIEDANLPDIELLNVLEGGLSPETRRWFVRIKYTGVEKWHQDHGLIPGMTLAIEQPSTWDMIKNIIVYG